MRTLGPRWWWIVVAAIPLVAIGILAQWSAIDLLRFIVGGSDPWRCHLQDHRHAVMRAR